MAPWIWGYRSALNAAVPMPSVKPRTSPARTSKARFLMATSFPPLGPLWAGSDAFLKGRRVAGHLHVRIAPHRLLGHTAIHPRRALPVRDARALLRIQFLVGEDRRHGHVDPGLGHAESPTDRIHPTRTRAPPGREPLNGEILPTQVLRASVRVDQGAAGVRVDRAVAVAQQVEHQLRLIVELEAEPIPPDLVVAKLGGAKLVIHPALAGDLQRAPGNDQH